MLADWRDSPIADPLTVVLTWTAVDRTNPGITLHCDRWIGWHAGAPDDWTAFLLGVSKLRLPRHWSMAPHCDEDIIFARTPSGTEAPALETEGFHHMDSGSGMRCAMVPVSLLFDSDVPREWSKKWNDDAWESLAPLALEVEALLVSSGFKDTTPLGLFPDICGRFHWANHLWANRDKWIAKSEQAKLQSTVSTCGSADGNTDAV